MHGLPLPLILIAAASALLSIGFLIAAAFAGLHFERHRHRKDTL